jgi:hypothetical protein
MSEMTERESAIKKVIDYLREFPQFNALSPETQLLLCVSLAERNLVGQVSGMVPPEMTGFVLKGLLADSNFVQCALIFGLGLPKAMPVPNDGGEPAQISEAAAAESTAPVVSAPAEIPLTALAGLADASPKLVTQQFVESMLRDARKHVSAVQTSVWVN